MSDFVRGRATFGQRGVDREAQAAARRVSRPERLELTEGLFMLFVGPHAASYAALRDRMRADGGEPGIASSWCWSAFFFPQYWLLYRKQWMLGLASCLAPMITGYLFNSVGFISGVMSIVFGKFGRSIYVLHAERRIRDICALRLSPEETRQRIERAGGVTWVPVILALIVTAVITVIILKGLAIARAAKGL